MEGRSIKKLSQIEFNNLCLAIQPHLTHDDRKAVLASCGFPPGTVTTYTKDNGSFWAWLSVQMLFDKDNLNVSLWTSYPEVQKLVREKIQPINHT